MKFGRATKFSQPAKFRRLGKSLSFCHYSCLLHCSPFLLFDIFYFFVTVFLFLPNLFLVIAFVFCFFGIL